jgi:hypothetical protein
MSYNWENWSCECENEVGISAQDAWVVFARLPRMDLQVTETLFCSGPCKLPSCLNYTKSWRLENNFFFYSSARAVLESRGFLNRVSC